MVSAFHIRLASSLISWSSASAGALRGCFSIRIVGYFILHKMAGEMTFAGTFFVLMEHVTQ